MCLVKKCLANWLFVFFLEIDFDNESLTCFKLIAAAYSAERTVGLTFDFFFLLLVA